MPLRFLLLLVFSSWLLLPVRAGAQAVQRGPADSVVVTSTRRERRADDAPMRVEVTPAAGVATGQLLGAADVIMVLEAARSVRVQPQVGALGGAGVRIRGLLPRHTQLLVDGLPLLGGHASSLSVLQFPPLDVAQLEVIPGPASALYGGHALGGVANLVSRRPDGTREALYRQTSRGGTDALVYWSGPAEALSYTFVGGLHAQSMEDLDDDVWADVPAYRRVTVRPRAYWRGARGSLVATTGGLWEKREGGTPFGKQTRNNLRYQEQLETSRADAGLNGSYLLSRALQLGVRASADRDRRERRLNTTLTNDARSTALLEGVLLGTAGAHQWLAGMSIERDSYSANELPLFNYRHTSRALLLQDEFRLRRDVVLAGGGRADFHSEYGTLLNGFASALYRPGEWRVRLSAGTGSSAPDLLTELTEALGIRALRPIADLEAESARGVWLDAGRWLGPVELSASLFATTVSDPLQARAPAPNQVELVNAAGRLRTRGAELSARVRQGAVEAFGGWTYLVATEPDPDSAGRRDVPLTPRQSGELRASWAFRDLVRLSGAADYVGEQSLEFDPFRTRSRPYLLLGVLAELQLGRVRLFLGAENLSDVRQTRTDPLLRPTRSRAGLWTTDVWAPLAGRVLSGGVRVRLGPDR